MKKKQEFFLNHHKFQAKNYLAIFKKLLFCIYFHVNFLKLILWLNPPNAVYLRGNCQLHSGFSHDKKSLVSVSVETQNFETNFFRIFISGKNAYHTIFMYENYKIVISS